MYNCRIIASLDKKDLDNIRKLFISEETPHGKRASLRMVQKKDGLSFEIVSHDAVALRATANTVMKILAVYEKVKNG